MVMAVNLSVRQLLVPGLGARVRSVLAETGLPAEALRLEITETVFLENSETVRETLAELDELGVRLCLDDFGTGYSSLGYLRDLPINLLKIDRGFVSRISELGGSGVGEVIETILSLARRLEVLAVAEGVETEAQADFLVRLGCGHAQGFLFSTPVDRDRALALLLKDREGAAWVSS
jgi:EAL domain-containing protein (putative c-di-GMP-specific phosphodiesterase class I)